MTYFIYRLTNISAIFFPNLYMKVLQSLNTDMPNTTYLHRP